VIRLKLVYAVFVKNVHLLPEIVPVQKRVQTISNSAKVSSSERPRAFLGRLVRQNRARYPIPVRIREESAGALFFLVSDSPR